MKPSTSDTQKLMTVAIEAVCRMVHRLNRLSLAMSTNPSSHGSEFEPVVGNPDSDSPKIMIGADLSADINTREFLHDRLPGMIKFVGEESQRSHRYHDEGRYLVVADSVDGSDMLELGINLWCSALVIYDTYCNQIIGSVVGLATRDIYFARWDRAEAYVIRGATARPLREKMAGTLTRGHSGQTKLSNAHIAFYGQKAKNFLPVLESEGLKRFMHSLPEVPPPRFRIYNFGGNPAIVRMVDQAVDMDNRPITLSIDAIFELKGQKAHDFIPSAYIALKRGAYMMRLDGTVVERTDLDKVMERPNEPRTYVIAATSTLAQDLRETLASQ